MRTGPAVGLFLHVPLELQGRFCNRDRKERPAHTGVLRPQPAHQASQVAQW